MGVVKSYRLFVVRDIGRHAIPAEVAVIINYYLANFILYKNDKRLSE